MEAFANDVAKYGENNQTIPNDDKGGGGECLRSGENGILPDILTGERVVWWNRKNISLQLGLSGGDASTSFRLEVVINAQQV